MCNALLHVRRKSESRPGWARVGGFLVSFGLAVLFWGAATGHLGRAQETTQSSTGEKAVQTSNSSNDSQAPSAPGNSAEGTAAGDNAEAPAQTGDSEGAAQTAVPNGETQGPTRSGATLASPARNGGASQSPTQSSRPQATGAHETPARKNTEIHPAVPQQIQQPSPYGNMPSLQDLYTQIPSGGGGLQRFGSDAFLLGTGNANELPMDLPVGPDYVLGRG